MVVRTEDSETYTHQQLRSYSVENPTRRAGVKAGSSFENNRTNRITSSSLAIVWSIIILVFVMFFSQYIAYYQPQAINGVVKWITYPILTEAFFSWLPILVTTLIFFVAGHIVLIYYKKYLVRESTLVILNLLVISTVLSLLYIFPFDFTTIPHVETASVLYISTKVALVSIVVIVGVGTLIRLIKLIVNMSLQRN
ncbi:hypothetical protein ACFLTP_01145 [Chloroflexota bacterium]